jgi:hypothetical protein
LSRKRQQEQAEKTAAILLSILDMAVGVSFGEEARMQEHEQEMILPPLAGIMGRLGAGTAEAIEKWSDPIVLLFGIATWGARIWSIASDRGDDGPKRPLEVAPAPSGSNGKVLRTDEVPPASPPADLLSRVQVDHAEVRQS